MSLSATLQQYSEVPSGHKKCSACFEPKPWECFGPRANALDGLAGQCRECRSAKVEAWRMANREVDLAKKRARHWANRDAANAGRKARTLANREAEKATNKAWREANKEVIRAKHKARYLANREVVLAKVKTYREANREAALARGKAWREANREARLAKKKLYREANKEDILAKVKAYREANKEQVASRVRAYAKTLAGKAGKKASAHKRRSRGQFAFDRLAARADFLSWEEHGAVCYLTGVSLLPGAVTVDHVVPLKWGGTHDLWNLAPTCLSANSSKQQRLVYFDLAARQPHFTVDPCPGGIGPNRETWPRIPLTQPTLDEMQAMVDAWKARRTLPTQQDTL